MTSANIIHHFLQQVEKHPNKAAIIDPKQSITFSQLKKDIENTATYFHKKGIRAGDRVLIFVPMSVELYRIVLAIFYMGATTVFLDEWVSKKRMEICCEIADCKAFIAGKKVRLLSVLSKQLRNIPIHLGTKYKVMEETIPPHFATPNERALITFTTGSTGIPKAANRTHGFLNEQFIALKQAVEPKEEDISMPVLPIVLLLNLGVGCTSIIADFKATKPEEMIPQKVINQIQQHKVNCMIASPFFIKTLALHLIRTKENTPSLQKIFTGGAPVFPNEARLYDQAFTTAKSKIVYGSTEAEPISSIETQVLTNEENSNITKGLNVGKPYENLIEVKVIEIEDIPIKVAKESDLKILGIGEIGEIIVAGKHVLSAYFNNEEALKRNKIFIDEKVWHRTGDAGYLSKEGYLYLTGRCSSMIQTQEAFIAPFLYENYLQNIEGVEMGTVLKSQQQIMIVVELTEQGNQERVKSSIKKSDLPFDQIKFIAKIPRDPRRNSKVAYKVLESIISQL